MQTQNFRTLDKDAIRRIAPSVFAETPHGDVSSKYGFISTSDLLDRMLNEGFRVTKADQMTVRDEGKTPFTKHMLRFRHVDAKPVFRDTFPEIVMFNSHDRSSGFSLEAGMYRLVCSNGLIAWTANIGRVACRHSKGNVDDAIEGVYSVIDNMPEISAQVEGMASTVLTRPEQEAFANSALLLRWDEGAAPVKANQILEARRGVDRVTDVYTTLNVVQENLIRGGINGRDRNNRRRQTRAVTSINADTKLNKALYNLAAEMVKIKQAA
jgi:hypothetical protein